MGGGLRLIENVFGCDVTPALSPTVTVKLKGLPAADVGAPEMTPLLGFKLSPGGSALDETIQLL